MILITAAACICALLGTPLRAASAQDTTRARRDTPVSPLPAPDSDLTVIVTGASRTWDALGAVRRKALRDSLDAQRRIWDARRPASYVIRVLTVDHCIQVRTGVHGNTIPRVTIVGTRVVKREESPIPRSYRSHCWHEWGVDELFADLARSIADTSMNVGSIQYDPAYGFPRYYWRSTTDRPAGVLVESFAPVR